MTSDTKIQLNWDFLSADVLPFLNNSSMKHIEGEGPMDANIMFIGDMPDPGSDVEGRPLGGQYGRMFDYILHEAGIVRSDCRIEYLIQRKISTWNMKADNMKSYFVKRQPVQQLSKAREILHKKINQVNPNIIVPMGPGALWAITGEKKIGNWRGSVTETTIGNKQYKVCGIFDMIAMAKMWSPVRPITLVDLIKIKAESLFPDVRRKPVEFIIRPTVTEALQFMKEAGESQAFTYDIETFSNLVTCISICFDGIRGMSIPFDYYEREGRYSDGDIMKGLDKLFNSNAMKIGQNIMYDLSYLTRIYNICPTQPWFDTMIAQYVCYPELPKDLGFLTSFYTDMPYYKSERAAQIGTDEHYIYNAKDAVSTFRVYEELDKEVDDLNVRKIYDMYMRAVEPLLAMTIKGICIDLDTKANMSGEAKKRAEEIDKELHELMPGVNVNSPKQLLAFFSSKYNRQLPNTNAKTMSSLAEQGYKEPNLIVERKSLTKLQSTYLDAPLDPEDGRMRCSFRIGGKVTDDKGFKSGRISWAANNWGGGTNLQNILRGPMRNVSVPDPGLEMLEADYSQAEVRLVAYISGDPLLIKVFTDGKDIHTMNAMAAFRVPEDQVTSDLRTDAKRGVHSIDYLVGINTLAAIFKTNRARAKQIKDNYLNTYLGIEQWHKDVQAQINRNRTLHTCLGHRRTFYGRINDTLLRDAVSWEPQTTVGGLMILALSNLYYATRHLDWFDMLLTVHDSLIMQYPPERRKEVMALCKEHLEISLTINGKTFIIPIDFKVGPSWGELKGVEYECN